MAAITGRRESSSPPDVAILTDFNTQDPTILRAEYGLAMTPADITFCQSYFRDEEKRDPSITEIKMLDTYWSDHCRHTTFLTKIDEVDFDDPAGPAARAWQTYLDVREQLGRGEKPVTLMDIALIGMRELRASGELDNLEVSEEVNAASIVVPVEISNLESQIPTSRRRSGSSCSRTRPTTTPPRSNPSAVPPPASAAASETLYQDVPMSIRPCASPARAIL